MKTANLKQIEILDFLKKMSAYDFNYEHIYNEVMSKLELVMIPVIGDTHVNLKNYPLEIKNPFGKKTATIIVDLTLIWVNPSKSIAAYKTVSIPFLADIVDDFTKEAVKISEQNLRENEMFFSMMLK